MSSLLIAPLYWRHHPKTSRPIWPWSWNGGYFWPSLAKTSYPTTQRNETNSTLSTRNTFCHSRKPNGTAWPSPKPSRNSRWKLHRRSSSPVRWSSSSARISFNSYATSNWPKLMLWRRPVPSPGAPCWKIRFRRAKMLERIARFSHSIQTSVFSERLEKAIHSYVHVKNIL